ncbi:hypothetical protein ANRL2_02605 [Anaerolineae bacterium]|nr:hypothetical protein ANRL2_02605 [Anaerolineae bacterium]
MVASGIGHMIRPVRWLCRRGVGTLLTVALAAALTVAAQEMNVPLEVQVELMVRVFSFDRAMDQRATAGLTVGILYQERYRTSANTADEVEELLSRAEWASSGPVQIVRIPWESRTAAEQMLRDKRVRILYIAPLRSVDMQSVSDMCVALQVPAFTGVPEYVNEGIPLGVARRGGKAAILVNLPAARRTGVDLSSRVLHIAEVIGE